MLIAQISDFHLKPEGVLAYDVADTATSLKRAVAHVNRLRPVPDLVLITGDLVDEGARESYSLLRQILSMLRVPFYMVPGNHDHKKSLQETFPDHRYLQTGIEEQGRHYYCFALESHPLRLIGLDTVTPGEHGGGLGAIRLGWLEQTLAARPDFPTLLFMHHPPFASAIGHMDKEVFRGWRAFESLISRHLQVERILCGHLHRPVFRRYAGTLASCCPAIGMQLTLDLTEQAPSTFTLEPPSVMLHLWAELWGEKTLLTHLSIVEDYPGQYSGPHPFFGVVSPD
jgi:3',5'-cyclic-AMP phosphodiesterase